MSCDVSEVLHLRHSSFHNSSMALPTSQMSRAHSPTLPLFHLRHSSFSNLSVTSPTSQLILQPFCRFTYVTSHSPTLPLLHLRHSSFSDPSFASPTSQALHLIHLAGRPCYVFIIWFTGRLFICLSICPSIYEYVCSSSCSFLSIRPSGKNIHKLQCVSANYSSVCVGLPLLPFTCPVLRSLRASRQSLLIYKE